MFQNMISPEAVAAAAKLFSSAKRPVFIVGAGGEDEQMWKDLAAISEAHQVSLCATFGHGSAIPNVPLAVGCIGRGGSRAAQQLLSEADMVAVIGSRLSRYTTVPYYGFEYWPKNAQIVHVEADWNQIGRHRPVDVGIAGDCREFLARFRKVTRLRYRDAGRGEATWASLSDMRA
jgi:sulfoacetaldehyde acetyltransferase